jgi:hypothetical protein
MAQMIKIDEVEYDADKLSNEAKAQLMHLRVIEVENARLQAQMAINQTARVAYVNALKAELAKYNAQSAETAKA